jgi:hypothetical protein
MRHVIMLASTLAALAVALPAAADPACPALQSTDLHKPLAARLKARIQTDDRAVTAAQQRAAQATAWLQRDQRAIADWAARDRAARNEDDDRALEEAPQMPLDLWHQERVDHQNIATTLRDEGHALSALMQSRGDEARARNDRSCAQAALTALHAFEPWIGHS